jgi:Ran GTPase-activating protein (RanGAP) involved in mRNA processing and transport
LRLTIAAVACAGLGVICGIPVHQLREDSVEDLNLSHRGLHVPAAMLVASLIPATSVLKSCNLLKSRFDVESAKKLAKMGAEKGIMLSGMTRNQTAANFLMQGLQPADAILIASDLQFMAVLTNLILVNNSIGAEGAIAIAEALKVNAVLTELVLYNNSIGVEGAKAIAEALKVNAVLTKLDLEYNSMGDAGKKAVRDAVKDRSGFVLEL